MHVRVSASVSVDLSSYIQFTPPSRLDADATRRRRAAPESPGRYEVSHEARSHRRRQK